MSGGRIFRGTRRDCHDQARLAARAAFPPDVARVITQVIDADADPSLRVPALRALDTLDGGLTAAHRALYHAALGDGAGALDRLERAYEEGADPNFLFYLIHPLFDGIRRDARFEAIAGGLGVEAPFAGLPPR